MLSPVRALGGCAWAAAVVRLLKERGELKLLLYQAVHRTILQAAASDHLWPVRRRLIAGRRSRLMAVDQLPVCRTCPKGRWRSPALTAAALGSDQHATTIKSYESNIRCATLRVRDADEGRCHDAWVVTW